MGCVAVYREGSYLVGSRWLPAYATACHYITKLRKEWPDDTFTLVQHGTTYEIHNTTRSEQR